MASVILALASAGLLLAGVAVLCAPAALIVAGLLGLAAALFTDFPTREERR